MLTEEEYDINLVTDDVIDNEEQIGGNDINTAVDVENDVDDCLEIGEQPEIKITETITDPDKRISKNKLTRYEFVRIIGERTQQLKKGAKPLVFVSKDSEALTEEEIAIEELKNNMIPFKIRRPVKNHYEIWRIDELDKRHLEALFK